MRVVIWLPLACIIASVGCGTVRAIQNNRAAPITVSAVLPQSGQSGEIVTFQAQVCTSPQVTAKPTFKWEFDGAAEPAVSFDESPTVTLKAGSATAFTGHLT